MANSSYSSDPGTSAASSDPPSSDALHELRTLLIEPEQLALDSLKERLENPVIRAQEVSRVLPDALALRNKQDSRISQELAPMVEGAFTDSIRKRPQVIVDVMAPIIGPLIRKAIGRAFRTMVQSTNQVLEQSLSWRGIQWRIEAWRTGKSFAEVVLLHTLRYRVEQVFLIHRKSGLLLQHVAADSVAIHDESMVSGMLSAIQAFVHDSFEVNPDSNLDSLQIGELTVWIEQSHDALLAAVIRGTPPPSLRTLIQETLEAIQIQFGNDLAVFQGDRTTFEATQPSLEDCLQYKLAEAHSEKGVAFWMLLGIILLGILWWWFPQYQDRQKWNQYLAQLKLESGITVTEQKEENGQFYIYGLRDALAADPGAILHRSGLSPQQVSSHWEPYFSLKPNFVLQRSIKVLAPPATVHLTFDNGILSAAGVASDDWRIQSRSLAPSLPGVLKYQDDQLSGESHDQLQQLKAKIEQTNIFFAQGHEGFLNNMKDEIARISSLIRTAQKLAKSSKISLHIRLIGFTDPTGDESQNRVLRRHRAQSVMVALRQQGFPSELFSIGTPAEQDSLRDKVNTAFENLRKVSFQVLLTSDS